MKDKATCYGCDYFFNVEELTDLIDSHLPDGIKLCPGCMSKGEGDLCGDHLTPIESCGCKL